MSHKVSIIMPCYNAADYVGAAIESVLKQTVPVQLIVIDDQSTDNSAEVLQRYSADIQILQSDHKGVAHARNSAIKHLGGRYTLLLDADDALTESGIRYLLDSMNNSGNRVVYGSFSSWDKSMQRRLHLHRYTKLGREPMTHLVRRNISPPGAILFPTDAFEKIEGFDQSVAGCEDWDFVIRLARTGYNFTGINKEVFYYRRVPFSASNQVTKMLESGLEVIRRCHDRDPRVQGDLYGEGYRSNDLDKNLFNYQAACLASSLFASGGESEVILRALKVPAKPDWKEFGEAFRKSIWWQSLAAGANQRELILSAQIKCVALTRAEKGLYYCSEEMINSVLFPDFGQLWRRPGPQKAWRLFREWQLASQIYKEMSI